MRRGLKHSTQFGLIGAICVTVCAAWLLWPMPESGLRIVGESYGMRAFSREYLHTRPKIDIALPLFGSVTWPKRPPLSDIVADEAGIVGTLEWGRVVGPWDWSTWIDGEHVSTHGKPGLRAPFVFGDEPREFDFGSAGVSTLRVSLPPTGQPAPVLPKARIQTGPGFLVAEPTPWISPSFPIGYQVWLEGFPPGSVWYAEVSFEHKEEMYTFVSGMLGDERRLFVPMSHWQSDMVVIGALLGVKPETQSVVTKRTPNKVDFVNSKGESVLTLENSGGNLVSKRLPSYKSMQVLDALVRSFYSPGGSQLPRSWLGLVKLRDGLKLDVTGYRLTKENYDFETQMTFPTMKSVGVRNQSLWQFDLH